MLLNKKGTKAYKVTGLSEEKQKKTTESRQKKEKQQGRDKKNEK